MTVGELISILSVYNENAEIAIGFASEIAQSIAYEIIDVGDGIVENRYSNNAYVVFATLADKWLGVVRHPQTEEEVHMLIDLDEDAE